MKHGFALLLSDARFPSGGHAHSGGIEQACDLGLLSDLDGLEDYLRGRLATWGVVSAHAAAAVCCRATRPGPNGVDIWSAVDAELDARIVSPAARLASRQQGRQLLRLSRHTHDVPLLKSIGADPHHPVAIGAVAAAGGLTPEQAAAAAAYGAVAGPASAAIRLLGLDPAGAARIIVGLTGEMDSVASAAARTAARPLAQLPSVGAPVADFLAELHFTRKDRLFAS